MKKDIFAHTIDLYNKLGKKYVVDTMKVSPTARDEFIKFIPKKGRVLDVGCAGGRDSRAFVKAGCETIYLKKEVDDAVKKSGLKIIFSKIIPDELKLKGMQWVTVLARK